MEVISEKGGYPMKPSYNFMNSNDLFSKVVFFIVIIMLFFLCFQLGVNLIMYIFSDKRVVYLVDGMKSAVDMQVIHQNPSIQPNKIITRSINERDGIELSWSLWLNINNSTFRFTTQDKHIFHKGNNNIQANGVNRPNNAPGLYIDRKTNDIHVYMSTFSRYDESFTIHNVPIDLWFHLVIRVKDRNVDVYVNGNIVTRHVLSDIPKQNYGNVYVNANGGFDGFLSDLVYYREALSPFEIRSITKSGPNKSMKSGNTMSVFPPYLSTQWFLFNNPIKDN